MARAIDPIPQTTYLGGSLNDYAFALAIHSRTGEVFVAGRTESWDFPGVAGGAQASYGGGTDNAFVARLNPTLTVLEQATYFGGKGIDYPNAVAIHPITGEVIVAGHTGSANLPATSGAAQPRYGGNYDAFVARFSPTLTELRQMTYLGGSGGDGADALAIDPVTGDIFVAGETTSTDFPATGGGTQTINGGAGNRAVGYDAFIARFNSTLTALKQATYLGGSGGLDVATGLAIHPTNGDVFVVGETDSPNFPGTPGGAQAVFGRGVESGFVSRLDPNLKVLKQSTYFGSDGYTIATSVAIDPVAGDVVIGGDTSSTGLPAVLGGAQPENGGGYDGFVARLTSSLTMVRQATYVGGEGWDNVMSLAIHPATGEVFVAGETTSTKLPRAGGGMLPTLSGWLDAFVGRFDSTLTVLEQTIYLGGRDRDTAWALAIDPMGEIIVAGDTRSVDFPATRGGAQPSFAGGDPYGGDAFVARLPQDLAFHPGEVPSRFPTVSFAPVRRPQPRPVHFP